MTHLKKIKGEIKGLREEPFSVPLLPPRMPYELV